MNIGEFMSQKDEIERLNNQINMIADFYKGLYKGQIKKITAIKETERKMKSKALIANKRLRIGCARSVEVLIKLKAKNKISITDQDIADSCFISLRTVIDARCRLKKGKLL